MNEQQRRALRRLERAFAGAQRAGLVFYGREETVTAYDADAIRAHLAAGLDLSAAVQREEPNATTVDTGRTYLDSGL